MKEGRRKVCEIYGILYSDYWLDLSNYVKTVSCDNMNLSRLYVNKMD